MTKLPRGCRPSAALPRIEGESADLPPRATLATSGGGFPLNGAVNSPCAARVRIKSADRKALSRKRIMARQFIYHMEGLSKVYPGNRKVLENINLSFYPDAKIGVLGVNGAGKSTLLRIMAGLDQDYSGEAGAAGGGGVVYRPQEPQLVQGKRVQKNAR